MNKLNKALVGTAAAAAMAVSATPAMAKDGRNGGPSAGEVIAGVAIIGAIAAIASSNSKDRGYHDADYRGDRYRNDRYANNRYRQIDQRSAVNRCVRAAEQGATYRGRASVTDIRDIDRTRNGYRIKGNILVEQNRGRYNRNSYSDKGKFTCYVDGNRVSDVQFSGLKYARR
ncbi:hypothetical protein C8024_15005 [Sphingopyxis sp. BSNA05]|uniref:hypothetical protein n=1 Tax=Sphingopyxis sp. BSNA05 TaxID=1236614 RepID=UPI001566C2BB|nr:hypothetical protein [Sphingopyxis sp. BSNA05]NRD90487.1 hypothetical protein [Sphingopyxis sp. BSNA05]